MKFRKSFIFLSAFLTQSMVLANCNDIVRAIRIDKSNLDLGLNKDFVDNSINDFARLFFLIDTFYKDYLVVPTSFKLEIVRKSSVAIFKKKSNTLRIPLVLEGDYQRAGTYLFNSMLSHEYGHAIFHENLALVDPLYIKNIDLAKSNLDSLAKKKADIDALFLNAYHELFADIVAVLAMDDLDSMKKLISGMVEGEGGIERSFLNNLSENEWEYVTPHYLFAPTRGFIGKNLIQGKVVDKGLLLKKIFDIMKGLIKKNRADLVAQLEKDPDLELYELEIDVIKMNKAFINVLKKEFSKI